MILEKVEEELKENFRKCMKSCKMSIQMIAEMVNINEEINIIWIIKFDKSMCKNGPKNSHSWTIIQQSSAPWERASPQCLICEPILSEQAHSCARKSPVLTRSRSMLLLFVSKSEKYIEKHIFLICCWGKGKKQQSFLRGCLVISYKKAGFLRRVSTEVLQHYLRPP